MDAVGKRYCTSFLVIRYRYQNSFLPTMPQSSFFSVQNAAAVQNTRIYQCPNGHCYVIGECLRPMEKSICPDCKSEIGGTNHKLLDNNTQGNITEAQQAGYLIPHPSRRGETMPERQLSKLSVSALRILMHAMLMLGFKRKHTDAVRRYAYCTYTFLVLHSMHVLHIQGVSRS